MQCYTSGGFPDCIYQTKLTRAQEVCSAFFKYHKEQMQIEQHLSAPTPVLLLRNYVSRSKYFVLICPFQSLNASFSLILELTLPLLPSQVQIHAIILMASACSAYPSIQGCCFTVGVVFGNFPIYQIGTINVWGGLSLGEFKRDGCLWDTL